ncbi:hypothetical protein AK830_g4665 [Neonectria ditissima]|uniref:Cyanovirin-N domain-containing protein n=1 Tax=Neonectria ditissima TaxID=78410 RepID=A0A0P7AVC2_9HYPO|nr:hypothetical protein AK830_g4665 [Neonectria ditissima]
MKFLATLAHLVATASAVDLYLHTNNNCGDSSLRCNNMNPNTCCGTDASNSPYQSIAVRGVNSGWNLQGRGYDNGRCNRLQTISGNNGNDWICNRSNGFRYTGAGYNFVGRKRAEPKSKCQRPNALVLADGTEYDLTDLSDDDYDGIVELGLKATSPEDVPEELQAFQIN